MEFNIKSGESAQEFLAKHTLDFNKEKTQYDSFGEGPNVYYLMKDEIFIKVSTELVVGDIVKFELKGREQNTRKALINRYIYEVSNFDSVCNKLILKDFKIELV